MKKATKTLLIVLCVLLAIPLLLLSIPLVVQPVREAYWKRYTFNYVLKHQEELNEYVLRYDDPSLSWQHFDYDGFTVCRADTEDEKDYTVQFDRFSYGLVPSSTYAGMYYSPTDTPSGYQARTWYMRGETEKICDNWYWFIMSF